MKPSTSAIVSAAQNRLQQSGLAALRDISCECRRGVLVLRGRVSSFYHKQLAQETVAGLKGVSEVVNEIDVVY